MALVLLGWGGSLSNSGKDIAIGNIERKDTKLSSNRQISFANDSKFELFRRPVAS